MFTDDYGNRRFPGLYRGIVFDTRDPLTRGRLRVQVPQVLGDAVTDWAWAKRDPGAPEAIPVVGAGVWVQFEGGDPSYPVWVGTFSSSATAGGGGGSLTQEQVQDYVAPLFTHNNHTNASVTYEDALNELHIDVTNAPSAGYTAQVKHEVKLGESIAKGQAVYVSSADGTNIVVSKASNTTEATSSKTLGLLEAGGSTNAKVNVVTEGLLAGLNTSTATAGDPVWLGTSGNLIYGLANKPVAPAHLVFIGIVTRSNSNNGEIFVKPQNGPELQELHNVLIGSGYASTPADNDLLAYDTASTLWKNQTAAQAGLITTSDARLTDTRTPTDGSVTTAKIVDANVTNAKLANSNVTINGSSVSLGGSATVTAAPTAHASTHTSGGADAITVAPSQVTGTAVVTADSRLSDSRTPTGAAGGKLSGTYPNPGINASLDDLNDVTVTGTPADNNLVAWNSATSQWTNQTASQAGVIATPNGTGSSITLNGLTRAEGIDVTRYVDIGGADDDFSPSLTVQANEDIDGEYPIAVFKSPNGTQVGGVSAQGVIDATDFTRSGTSLNRVYSQTTQPSGGNIGDIWIDTDSAQNTIGATPRFNTVRTANQSVANSTTTVVTYSSITENTGGFVSSSGAITVPLTGRYSITGQISWAVNGTGYRQIQITQNGTALWGNLISGSSAASTNDASVAVTSEKLTANDIIRIQGAQNSGGALNITSARLVIEYLGA